MTTLDNLYLPSQPRTLHFYNRKRRCVKVCDSLTLLPFNAYSDKRFQTQSEYIIAIESILASHTLYVPTEHWEDDGKWPQPYSFIEVFNLSGAFITRHYVRHGKLAPFQFAGYIGEDPYISKRLTSDVPLCNWTKAIWEGERSTGPGRRKGARLFGLGHEGGINLQQFINKYKLKP